VLSLRAWLEKDRPIQQAALVESCLTAAMSAKDDDAGPIGVLQFLGKFEFLSQEIEGAVKCLQGLVELPSAAQPFTTWQNIRASLKASHPIVKHCIGLPWAVGRLAKMDKYLLDSKKTQVFGTKLEGTQATPPAPAFDVRAI
jgi:hypothetical protein